MKIDLDEKETSILLNSLRQFYYDMVESNKDLVIWQEAKTTKQEFCCCIDDGRNAVADLKKSCAEEEQYYRNLRDKLKKFQMIFPCEEHNPNRQYRYGKTFGHEKAKWDY